MQSKYKTIDEYIADMPKEQQPRLEALRRIIREGAPEAKEKISWGMPTYTLDGNLIHFAQHKTHIGLYPGPEAIEHFAAELEGYKTSKGAIQLPLAKPLPEELIRKIVAYNVKQHTGN